MNKYFYFEIRENFTVNIKQRGLVLAADEKEAEQKVKNAPSIFMYDDDVVDIFETIV